MVVGECLRRRGFDLCLITFIIPNDDDDDVADDDDNNNGDDLCRILLLFTWRRWRFNSVDPIRDLDDVFGRLLSVIMLLLLLLELIIFLRVFATLEESSGDEEANNNDDDGNDDDDEDDIGEDDRWTFPENFLVGGGDE